MARFPIVGSSFDSLQRSQFAFNELFNRIAQSNREAAARAESERNRLALAGQRRGDAIADRNAQLGLQAQDILSQTAGRNVDRILDQNRLSTEQARLSEAARIANQFKDRELDLRQQGVDIDRLRALGSGGATSEQQRRTFGNLLNSIQEGSIPDIASLDQLSRSLPPDQQQFLRQKKVEFDNAISRNTDLQSAQAADALNEQILPIVREFNESIRSPLAKAREQDLDFDVASFLGGGPDAGFWKTFFEGAGNVLKPVSTPAQMAGSLSTGFNPFSGFDSTPYIRGKDKPFAEIDELAEARDVAVREAIERLFNENVLTDPELRARVQMSPDKRRFEPVPIVRKTLVGGTLRVDE